MRQRSTAADADLAAVSSTAYLPDRGERGRIVLATKPTILVCDLRLRPGQAHKLQYSQRLPVDAMPTYLGQAVRYVYKVGTRGRGIWSDFLEVVARCRYV